MSVDLEDWFHVCGLKDQPRIPPEAWRVRGATEVLLDLFAEFKVKTTFFVLGCVAEADPGLVRNIHRQGHEIASHGYSHRLVHELSPAEFSEELHRTEDVIMGITGCRPVGFRAPQWSATARTSWFDDILAQRGYTYDSSRNPLPFVGDRNAERHPYRIQTTHGILWEIPPMVSSSLVGNLPTGGGWGFRFFPFAMISATVEKYGRADRAAVLYLHPREVDPDGPRLKLPLLKRFASYGTRRDALPRLRRLLGQYTFTTLREQVDSWQSAS
ncbi:polysaccharide deacetylase family protein [Geobacter sp. AOG2]|uniref:polysaccharide deacetylase family protein n=1 Tax=Geobacter sp. AOG2 TaxID=1566347 RepID=UPI001CC5BC57|nr:polysaccharide deacetylase family protein [Geobacter sp. AOG2]